MTALSLVSVHPSNITIAWANLTDPTLNGRSLPIFYSVEFKSSDSSSTWTELNTGGPLVLNYTHSINPAIFDPTLLYMYRVRAENVMGMSSVYSAVLTVTPD